MNKEKLMQDIDNAGYDNTMFGNSFIGGYYIQQDKRELSELVCFLMERKLNCENYLEIGTAAGGTIRFISDNININNLHVIDDGRHVRYWKYKENKKFFKIKNLVEYIGNSHSDKAKEFLKTLNVFYDIICVDGDHSYNGIKKDLELVKPYVTKGTIIWFHDSNLPEIKKFLNEVKEEYEYEKMFDINYSLGITVLVI